MPITRQHLTRLWVFAALRSGNPYVYGGSFAADPAASTDCSGAVFSAAALLSGRNPHQRWGSTETLRLARLNHALAPCGLLPAPSKESVPADAPFKVGVMHGAGGGANSHTACSFFLDGRRFDFESRGAPGVLLDRGARGWDHPLFHDFWYLPGPATDDPDAWPLPPGAAYGPYEGPDTQLSGLAAEPVAWMAGLRDFQKHAAIPETGVYDPAARDGARRIQNARGLPATGLVDETTWRAARDTPRQNGANTMPDDITARLGNVEQKLDQILAQLGPWPQSGDRTLLDTTAAVAAKLAVPGCRDTLAA